MKLIYQNFDGLDFSVNGAFPENVLQVLREAKEESQSQHGKKVLAYIGSTNLPVHVYPTGAKGGYFFTFDTGPDGAIWFVKDTDIPRAGNIRISCTSLFLALNGYEKGRDILLLLLMNIGAIGVFEDEWSLPLGLPPNVKIGRIDYCFDFIMDDDFEPNPKHFICHPRTKIKGVIDEKPAFEMQGGYFQSVMVGKMPNRQLVIYDKTAEIIDHIKPYWWDIWGLDKDTFQGAMWRVEARAGSAELDSWNIRTFDDLNRKAGDVFLSVLKGIRLTVPSSDTNRSRWPNHPLWDACIEAGQNALAPYISKADRKKVITDLRENVKDRAVKNIRGAFATMNHLLGNDVDEVAKTIEFIADDVFTFAEENPKDFQKRVKRAKDKYVFLDEEDEGNE